MYRKYFKTTERNYEAIRSAMDTKSGYPSDVAETWFVPADKAVRDSENNCLIAAKPPIAEKFLLSNAIEITEEEYKATFPQAFPTEEDQDSFLSSPE